VGFLVLFPIAEDTRIIDSMFLLVNAGFVRQHADYFRENVTRTQTDNSLDL
jgi:hypothetical protein